MKRAFVFALLASMTLLGQTARADEPGFYDGGLWSLQPLPLEVDPSPQQRAVGELLFSQGFGSTDQAVLTQRFEARAFTSRLTARIPITLDEGTAFHSVIFLQPDRLVFCDPGLSYSRLQRLCFMDSDRDGVFDNILWAGAPNSLNFAPMFLLMRLHSEIAVPYRLRSEPSDRLLSAGVIVTRGPTGAYRLKFALARAGRPQILENGGQIESSRRPEEGEVSYANEVHFRASDIPLTLELAGARIEITAISEGVVSYRVLSSFSAEAPFAIAHFEGLPH